VVVVLGGGGGQVSRRTISSARSLFTPPPLPPYAKIYIVVSVFVLYMFTYHAVHAVSPFDTVVWGAAHWSHSLFPVVAPKYPKSQNSQSSSSSCLLISVLSSPSARPTGQSAHATDPANVVILPFGHTYRERMGVDTGQLRALFRWAATLQIKLAII
jgi:hypothetical protein